jgi:hypothetical protein
VSKKLEEKQRRRIEQERRERQAKRESLRRNLITLAVVVIVGGIVVTLIARERGGGESPSGVDPSAAGCTDIERPPEASAQHVPEGTRVQYSTRPPTSGDHYGEPAGAGFYEPATASRIPEEQFVHNLEHGQIIIWYAPTAPEELRENIQDYIESQPGEYSITLIGVPYEQVPAGSNYTMTAWGAMQSCEQFSAEAIDSFRTEFQGKGPEQIPNIPPFEV